MSGGISSFQELLQSSDAQAHLRPGGNEISVVREWTALVSRHYYELVNRAIRKADPEALIFGDRLPGDYDPDAVRAMAPFVDAVATNYNVDSPDGWIAHYYFDGLRQLTGNKPVLVSEWYFAAAQNRTGNLNNGDLMTVKPKPNGPAAPRVRCGTSRSNPELSEFTGSSTTTSPRADARRTTRITISACSTPMGGPTKNSLPR